MTRRLARVVRLAALAGSGGLACRPPPAAAIAEPHDGVAIALYTRPGGDGYGVVDDRRWVELAGGAIDYER